MAISGEEQRAAGQAARVTGCYIVLAPASAGRRLLRGWYLPGSRAVIL